MRGRGFNEHVNGKENPDGEVITYAEEEGSVELLEKNGIFTRVRKDEDRKKFRGLSRDQLLYYRENVVWKRVRYIIFSGFWILYAVLVAIAAVLLADSPKCATPPRLSWLDNGLIYKIDVPNFIANIGENTHGHSGTLSAITELLKMSPKNYFYQLDARILILHNIYEIPKTHSNMSLAYHRINSTIGTKDDLEELYHVADKKNIKILLDLSNIQVAQDDGDITEFANFREISGTEYYQDTVEFYEHHCDGFVLSGMGPNPKRFHFPSIFRGTHQKALLLNFADITEKHTSRDITKICEAIQKFESTGMPFNKTILSFVMDFRSKQSLMKKFAHFLKVCPLEFSVVTWTSYTAHAPDRLSKRVVPLSDEKKAIRSLLGFLVMSSRATPLIRSGDEIGLLEADEPFRWISTNFPVDNNTHGLQPHLSKAEKALRSEYPLRSVQGDVTLANELSLIRTVYHTMSYRHRFDSLRFGEVTYSHIGSVSGCITILRRSPQRDAYLLFFNTNSPPHHGVVCLPQLPDDIPRVNDEGLPARGRLVYHSLEEPPTDEGSMIKLELSLRPWELLLINVGCIHKCPATIGGHHN